jgi:predicted transcriptional regulator
MTNQPFQTMKEVDDYLSGDSIACLVCGQRFPFLHRSHLQSHGLSHDEYRMRFGIPFTRSLTSAPFRATNSALARPELKERLARGRAAMLESPPHRSARRPFALAVIDQWRKNGANSIASTMVTAACPVCSREMVTTVLAAAQPVRCTKCATPAAQKGRESYWHKKAVAQSEKDPLVHPPFETDEEIDDYLAGDTIACLICEARLQRLDKHLPSHRMSVDEYRVRFNIPFDRPLMSAPCRATIRARFARINRADGEKRAPPGQWVSPWRRRLTS